MAGTPRKHGATPDYFLVAVIFIITVFGLAMLASASSDLGKIKFDNSYYYLQHQLLYGLTVGALGFFVGYAVYFQRWRKIAFILLLISVCALVLVFTPLGSLVNGTNRWLRFGPLSFQPAELMKLTFIMYLAAWLSNPKFKRTTDFQSGLLPFGIISTLIAGLLILQPATSTVLLDISIKIKTRKGKIIR